MALLSLKVTTAVTPAGGSAAATTTVKSAAVSVAAPITLGIQQNFVLGPPGVGSQWKGLYSSGTTYAQGDGVTGSNGHNYISLVSSNLNHDPTTDAGVHWVDTLPPSVVRDTSDEATSPVVPASAPRNRALRDFVSVLDFGAVSDARGVTDAAITTGTNQLHSTAAAFTSADNNKWVQLQGAAANAGGSGAQNGPLVARILSVSGGVATLSISAGNTVSGAVATIGTGNKTAFLNAYNTGKRVFVPGTGTGYLIEAGITGSLPLNMYGDGVGQSIIYYASVWMWTITGTGPGSALALTADSTIGDHTLAFNTTGIAVNDYLAISSTDAWTASESNNNRGEVVRVQSINSGALATIYGPTFDTYTMANSAQVQKMTYLAGHSVKGIEFLNGAPESADGGVTYGAGNAGLFWFQYCERIDIENCRVRGSHGASFFFLHCLYFDVGNVRFDDSATASVGAPNAFGYGVYPVGSTQYGLVHNCKSRRGHHAILTTGGNASVAPGGVPRFIDIEDCTAADADVPPYHTHFTGEYITFRDCKTSRSPYLPSSNTFYRGQFFINGKNCKVINPHVDGYFGAGICISGGDNNVIEGASVRNGRAGNYGIAKAGGSAGSPSGIEIANATNTKIRNVDIDGVTGTAGDGIFIYGGGSGVTGTEIKGVTVRNTTRDGIRIEDLTDSTIVDDVLGINNGSYVIETTVASPAAQWEGIRGINPTTALTSTTGALIDATEDDGLPGIIAPANRNFTYTPSTLVPAVSTAYLGRIRPSRLMVITKIAFVVSVAATTNDNVDVGIYDSAGTRIVSAGSTASQANATGVRTISVASTTLLPGKVYYVALAYGTIGGTAATMISLGAVSASASVIFGSAAGQIAHSVIAASFPLPSSLTIAAPAANAMPMLAARES